MTRPSATSRATAAPASAARPTRRRAAAAAFFGRLTGRLEVGALSVRGGSAAAASERQQRRHVDIAAIDIEPLGRDDGGGTGGGRGGSGGPIELDSTGDLTVVGTVQADGAAGRRSAGAGLAGFVGGAAGREILLRAPTACSRSPRASPPSAAPRVSREPVSATARPVAAAARSTSSPAASARCRASRRRAATVPVRRTPPAPAATAAWCACGRTTACSTARGSSRPAAASGSPAASRAPSCPSSRRRTSRSRRPPSRSRSAAPRRPASA